MKSLAMIDNQKRGRKRMLTCARVYQALLRTAMTLKELEYEMRKFGGRTIVWRRVNELRRKEMVRFSGRGSLISTT